MIEMNRETTAQTIARILARAELEREPFLILLRTEQIQEGASPQARHSVRFHYSDGSTQFFKSHERA